MLIVKNLTLNKYSKNYLNHLFNTNEILASMILTLHNINFYQELMQSIRDNIKKGTFLMSFTINIKMYCDVFYTLIILKKHYKNFCLGR